MNIPSRISILITAPHPPAANQRQGVVMCVYCSVALMCSLARQHSFLYFNINLPFCGGYSSPPIAVDSTVRWMLS